MKQLKHVLIIAGFLFIALPALRAQDVAAGDSTGLPGDNFSLQGALEMFKKASSVEEFEKLLNTENNNVNNLDLNGDGDIDYVRVIDKSEGDVHAFVLQVPVSETENQDIAVIELEKTGNESAVLQIIGDEEIYGEKAIVEPGNGDDGTFISNETMQTGGPNGNFNEEQSSGIVVNVWIWPCVRFVYAPVYRPWVSPWRWRVYPTYWHPWHPLAWHVFHPLRLRYHYGYAVCHTNRVLRAHAVYGRTRVVSVSVHNRNNVRVNQFRTNRHGRFDKDDKRFKDKDDRGGKRGKRRG